MFQLCCNKQRQLTTACLQPAQLVGHKPVALHATLRHHVGFNWLFAGIAQDPYRITALDGLKPVFFIYKASGLTNQLLCTPSE